MPTIKPLTEASIPELEAVVALVHVWREARKEHLQFLTDLHSEAEDAAYLANVILRTNQVWVAEADRKFAGFIAYGDGWVNHLYVSPHFQRQGIGTELLAIAKRSHPMLQLWVFESNLPAIRFYEDEGFRVVERTSGSSNEAKRPDLRMQWDDH